MIFAKSITSTVYIVNNNRVLLHMHKKYHTWFPVGGHMNSNEFPYQTAYREAKEETGFDIELVKTELSPDCYIGHVQKIPMPFCTYYEGIGHDEEFYDFIFIATTKDGTPKPQPGESHEFHWFSKEELLDAPDETVKPHIKNTALSVLSFLGI
jgi:8-oxo-dGTP pyrophosphatase MutT (NUDIX family)